MKFFKCKHCGNIATLVEDKNVPLVCCGEKMHEMIAGEVDGAKEKHVPVYEVNGNVVKVQVGSVAHPMTEAHLISFIAIESKQGIQIKKLSASDQPEAAFALAEGDELVAVYEYCNLHGLWKA